MKKRITALLLAMVMTFAMSISAFAADDTSDSSNDADKVNGKTYFYDQFDNSAYRTVYKQINDAAASFHDSTQTAQYQDCLLYTSPSPRDRG